MPPLTESLQLLWQLYWPSLAVVLAFAVAERVWPLEANQPWRATLFNLIWHALFLAIFLALMLSQWGRLIGWLAAVLPAPLLPRATSTAGEWGRLALALLAHDFFVYWGHRLMHTVPALWAFHKFHHDERHLNASTSLRQHWLSIPVHQLVVFLPLTWLFGASVTPGLVFYGLIVLGAFHHANLHLPLGWLSAWITGPQYHRIHHAPPRELHDSNYASLFPLWDRLFGTCRMPEVREPGTNGLHPGSLACPHTGLQDVAPTTSQWRALIQPLPDWWKMLRSQPAIIQSNKE